MGAYDTYSGTAPCPVCGDWHWLGGQTTFFEPHFDLPPRWFRAGEPQPLQFTPDDLLREPWSGSWIRIRTPRTPEILHLLPDIDGMYPCACGTPLAEVLRFRLRPDGADAGTATLVHVGLYHALADPRALDVDAADGEQVVPWRGNLEAFEQGLRELAASPPDVRAARLHAALTAHFQKLEAARNATDGFTFVTAPMPCEACGDTRERTHLTHFTGPDGRAPFLRDGWTGGTLRPGTRVEGDFGWLDEDVDRGIYVRLRHPVPADGFTIIGARENVGCRCGAGATSVVMRFARDPGGVTFTGASLRVVRGRADVADGDFAPGSHGSRDFPNGFPQPATRDEAVQSLLRTNWRCP
ncbi:hypothetical protein [Longimicrobium sp.]|uniref:hypothetical protein n=1 Tax=Longimicrobium sp. TaxID=2029185 RepID=UPI002E3724FF|nr:hypothetical protein [Longimicrobium sp.]HEX6042145.1 hypothetical protein [Longimicrobium sp.]